MLIHRRLLDDDDMNSTNDEYINLTRSSLPTWVYQQLIICIISVSLGTLLVFVTFIVPAVIIIRRIRRDKHRLNFKELRRISDFIFLPFLLIFIIEKKTNISFPPFLHAIKNEDMENKTLQRRSTATTKHMGVDSYPAFGAQGNHTDDQLSLLPVLQDTHSITQERHTLYDEQLPTSNPTMNWEMESNYICPTVNNNYVHLNECVLQPNSSTTIIQNPQTTKLNNEEEIQADGIGNPTQPPSMNNTGTTKQNFANFASTDLNGSKVIRLVRAKQATKRKSSLDTLIEVVQKELLRVNGQTNSTSPSSSPPHYSQTRSSTSSKQSQQQRSMISTVLPSSHPSSLTSQSNQSFKTARKRAHQHLNNPKRIPSNRNRNKSFNHDDLTDDIDLMDEDNIHHHHHHHDEQQQQQLNDSIDATQSSSSTENIEEIVRDTVDKLVAITLLNNAPFIVNMITGTNTNTETKSLANPPNTNATTSTKSLPNTSSSEYYRNDLALLSSTASELRNSMQQTSPVKQQIILQPTIDSIKPSTVFVAPRILNFQTVVPKPTTNIQIGNTKIILVSPTTNSPASLPHQQQCLVNNSPVKLVKLTSTLPKNVQIVIPSRTSHESLSTTIRPLSTLTTCSIDQIPQAAQEVTVTTSPNLNKPRRRSSSTTPTDKPVGKILRPIAKVLPVYSANNSNHATNLSSTITSSSTHDELIKPLTVNFQQRPTSTHGPMIYRMTSVNPNVPVFRVRAATAPTSSTINTDAKSISVATPTSMCYDPKQTHNTTTTGGSVSVLACFKTTKKRIKERAIMPRPSTIDSLDTSTNHPSALSTTNLPLIINNHTPTDDLANSNSSIFPSADYRQQSTATRLSLPTTLSNKKLPKIHLLSVQEQNDHHHLSSSNSRPMMEDKSIQCIDGNQNSTEEQITNNNSANKRNGQAIEESWTVAADTLLRNVLSQYGFRFLDVNCQQNLSTKFDIIQANLVSGMISSKAEFYQSVLDIKDNLLQNGLSKISADNLEKLFHYFEVEYPKIRDGDTLLRTNDRKRTRRQ